MLGANYIGPRILIEGKTPNKETSSQRLFKFAPFFFTIFNFGGSFVIFILRHDKQHNTVHIYQCIMREIIQLQVGQCGNQVANKFWEVVREEHALDGEGRFTGQDDILKDRLSVYFQEADNARYVPRAVLVDLGKDNARSADKIQY